MIRFLIGGVVGAAIATAGFLVSGWHKTEIGRFRIERVFGDSTFVTIDTATGALHYSSPGFAGNEEDWVQAIRTDLRVTLQGAAIPSSRTVGQPESAAPTLTTRSVDRPPASLEREGPKKNTPAPTGLLAKSESRAP